MNTTVASEERIARAELTWIAEPGDHLLGRLVRMIGAARAMTMIRAGRIPGDAEIDPAWDAQREVNRWHAALEKVPSRGEVERALGGPFRLVYPGCAEWPDGLDGLGDAAPIALWVTGVADLRFSCLRSVAVVGARAATAYGSYVAAELAASVAARGWTVVSGGAFGVDAAAHRGALGADGVTVAVLAGGLDVPYPAAHVELLDAIAQQGAIASEQPPGGDRQRAAAGPERQQAAVPQPRQGDRRARNRDARGGRGRAQWRNEHRQARAGSQPTADGGARAGHLGPVGRMPPHHQELAGISRHQWRRRYRRDHRSRHRSGRLNR
jgi:predicted Rossmann fold nucleotide-binding protein DprA/Smf involved in DNA uptake